MRGHHEVRVFRIIAREGHTHRLPDGWKPFAYGEDFAGSFVVCRRWVRDEKSASPPATVESGMWRELE